VCYNALNGEQLWHRTDLSKTQHLRFSASSNTLWCMPDEASTKGLDPSSGETLLEMRGLSDLFESPHSPCMLLVPRKRDYILTSRDDFRIPRLSCAVLDVAFTRDAVLGRTSSARRRIPSLHYTEPSFASTMAHI